MANNTFTPNMTEAIEGFCARLQTESKSPGTIAAYRRDLAMLVRVASLQITDLSCLHFSPLLLDQIFSAPEMLTTKRGPRSAASLHRMKAAVRSFFAWTFETGITPDNPARMIRMRRLPRRPPVFLTISEKNVCSRS